MFDMPSKFAFKNMLFSIGVDTRTGVDGFLFLESGRILAFVKKGVFVDVAGNQYFSIKNRDLTPFDGMPLPDTMLAMLKNNRGKYTHFPLFRGGIERYINTLSDSPVDLSMKYDGHLMVDDYDVAFESLKALAEDEC